MIEDDHILIEKYLKDLLSETETELFLKRVDSDLEFSEYFKLEQQLFDSLNSEKWSFVERQSSEVKAYQKVADSKEIENLKDTLSEVNSNFSKKSTRNYKKYFYYIAAASLVVFLSTQFLFTRNISNQDLYNDYVGLNDLPSFTTRGEINDIEGKLVKAENYFDTQNYKEALALFEPILDIKSNNISIYIYTGISQTELGAYSEAEQTFENLVISGLANAQVGHWYKALLYLKQDKVEASKTVLESIISNSYHNHLKAKMLLETLNDD